MKVKGKLKIYRLTQAGPGSYLDSNTTPILDPFHDHEEEVRVRQKRNNSIQSISKTKKYNLKLSQQQQQHHNASPNSATGGTPPNNSRVWESDKRKSNLLRKHQRNSKYSSFYHEEEEFEEAVSAAMVTLSHSPSPDKTSTNINNNNNNNSNNNSNQRFKTPIKSSVTTPIQNQQSSSKKASASTPSSPFAMELNMSSPAGSSLVKPFPSYSSSFSELSAAISPPSSPDRAHSSSLISLAQLLSPKSSSKPPKALDTLPTFTLPPPLPLMRQASGELTISNLSFVLFEALFGKRGNFSPGNALFGQTSRVGSRSVFSDSDDSDDDSDSASDDDMPDDSYLHNTFDHVSHEEGQNQNNSSLKPEKASENATYLRKVHKQIPKVDQAWFHKMYERQCSSKISDNVDMKKANNILRYEDDVNGVLANYLPHSFVSEMVSDLHFEDDRINSPRLSVLKALYCNCSSYRSIILKALHVASCNRVARSVNVVSLATKKELDVNVFSIYEEVDTRIQYSAHELEIKVLPSSSLPPSSQNTLTKASTMVRKSLSNAYSEGATVIKLIRDHDNSVVELLWFILSNNRPQLPFAPTNTSSSTTFKIIQQNSLNVDNLPASEFYHYIEAILANVLRCYGSPLGKKNNEVLDEPMILASALKIVTDLASRDYPDCCVHLLRQLQHSWPRSNTVQLVAYLKVCHAILLNCKSLQQLQLTQEKLSGGGSREHLVYTLLRRMIHLMEGLNQSIARQTIDMLTIPLIINCYLTKFPSESWRIKLSPHDPDNDSSEFTLLDHFVNLLRQGRKDHWHPLVRDSCNRSLDLVFDYLD